MTLICQLELDPVGSSSLITFDTSHT
ncbi:hypothetical protein JL09_g6713 [Pichia kudriavzevii]|uniref:Uncharacterized protein n=1 Tax=Pichia kudriavzevii TaxID=4909 RepID=A0A099NKQ2_PICKU|nr:hypothetical protein JL09_g6714 [Pichia kudriavzevii]KGK32680.1 hypothetical protein JL09_g6713 [Pichia kudriavzevii]